MITLQHVYKSYQSLAVLQDITLEIHRGEIFGIMGCSGAGKSTLLRCINLLERPDRGKIIVDGVELNTLSREKLRGMRRHIGMIFQHFNLLSSRTIYQNIAFPLEIVQMPSKEIRAQVMAMVQLTGLEDKLSCYPAQLSGGQKQRAAIARALISGSKILLCDEATSSLDPETTHSILELLTTVRSQLGVTILLITHEMAVIKSICDRVALIEQGELIEYGATVDMFTHPKTEVAQRFVSGTFPLNLPAHMAGQMHAESQPQDLTVLRLWFLKESAQEPIIAHLIQRFQVEVTILQASLEYIQHHLVGVMIMTLDAPYERLALCLEYLAEQAVQTDLMGYLASTHQVISPI